MAARMGGGNSVSASRSMGHVIAPTALTAVPPDKREKRVLNTQIPVTKSTGVPFKPLLSVIASFTTAPSPKAWIVLQGHPRGSEP